MDDKTDEIRRLMSISEDEDSKSPTKEKAPEQAGPALFQSPGKVSPDKQKELPKGPAFSPETMKAMGIGANAINGGATGFQLGSMVAPLTGPAAPFMPAIGGVGGALIGGMMQPSQTPGQDLGASSGDMIGGMLADRLPGVGPGARITRALIRASGIGLGSTVGSVGDKQADFQPETQYGKIGVYTGVNLAMLMAQAALPAKASKVAEMADKYNLPTSVPETTGSFGGLTDLMGAGSGARRTLGVTQNKAGLAALDKLAGAPMSDSEATIKKAAEGTGKVLDDVDRIFNSPKPSIKKLTPDEASAKLARESFDGPSYSNPNPVDTLQSRYGLDYAEAASVNKILRTDPETVIEHFMTSGGGNRKGEDQLGSVMKILTKEDPETAGNLANALATRLIKPALKETAEYGTVVEGTKLAESIQKFGVDRLKTAIGSDRAQALMEVSQVINELDPSGKIFQTGLSRPQQVMSYLLSKQAFAIMSGTALGASQLGSAVGGAVAGSAAGLAFVIPLTAMVNAAMHSPRTAKFLLDASRQNPEAANRLVRSLVNAGYNAMGDKKSQDASYGIGETKPQVEVDLSGLFGRGK